MKKRKPGDYRGNQMMIEKVFECGDAAGAALVERQDREYVAKVTGTARDKRMAAQAKRERKNARRAALLEQQE